MSERSWAILDSCDQRSYLESNPNALHERQLSRRTSCKFDCSTSRALDVKSSPSSDQSYEDLSARTRLLKGLLFYRENGSIGLTAALFCHSALSSALITTPKHHFYNPTPTPLTRIANAQSRDVRTAAASWMAWIQTTSRQCQQCRTTAEFAARHW
jgi:hypothetical protein